VLAAGTAGFGTAAAGGGLCGNWLVVLLVVMHVCRE